ncbi:MAG: ATP-binding protein, partial [Bacteroidota bacterium]
EEKMLKPLMLANVSHFYFSIDNYEKAQYYIEQAFDIAKRNNYPIILTNYSDEYGRILTRQNKFELAEEILLDGLVLSRQLKDERAEVGNLNALVEYYLAQDLCVIAKAVASKVPDLASRKGFYLYYANHLVGQSKIAFCEGNYSKAVAIAQKVLKLDDGKKLITYKQAARKVLAKAYQEQGRYQQAFSALVEYDSVNDFLIKTKKVAAAAELEAQYTFKENQKAIGYLEKEKQMANNYIQQLWLILIALLLSIFYIFYLLKRRRKTAELLQEKNQELNQYIASNLQLENFAYIASHDLRAPILTIKNFVKLVQKSAHDRLTPQEIKSLQFTADSSEDMLNLVDGLMNFSTLQKGSIEKENIHLPAFVDYVLDLNRPLISEAKASIEVDIQTPYIEADRSKLLQLIQNLVQNALKFHKKDTVPNIKISGRTTKDGHLISVSDNGIGISPNYFERIFLLFKRLHNKHAYKGTGIGLALCKKVVEMHNGKIWVESEEGEGATFYCAFPR